MTRRDCETRDHDDREENSHGGEEKLPHFPIGYVLLAAVGGIVLVYVVLMSFSGYETADMAATHMAQQ